MVRSLRLFLGALAAAALIATGGFALAEPSKGKTVVVPPAPAKSDAAAKAENGAVLNVPVDHGVPITLKSAASSVFIANPDVADIQVLSPTSVMVFGKKTGQTTLLASDANGQTLLYRTVMVAQNLDDLRAALKAAIPGGKINVETVPNGIVLTGEAKDAGVIEDARRLALRFVPKDGGDIINRVRVRGSNQIHIRVRFAEVSRDADKRFGIDWESVANIGGVAFGLASGSALIPTVPGSTLPYYPQGNIGSKELYLVRPTTGGDVNNILSFSKGGINGMIDALAQEGFVTLLAEPNLTAMSGETASFLAGGEFPVPVPQTNNTIGIEWKTYGVSLAFTPTLIGEDRINMHVRPEVSQLSDAGAVTINGITVPALSTRRAETTLELSSGQSFVIGGLLNNNQAQSVSKYPFLGDMPVLGPLFRSTRFQNNESELVIIITPYVVRPTDGEQLALPTDGYRAPDDVEHIFKMRTSSEDNTRRPLSGPPVAQYAPPTYAEGAEPPSPQAAPVARVSMTPEPSPVPVRPVPEKPVSRVPAPSSMSVPAGPGGFIVE